MSSFPLLTNKYLRISIIAFFIASVLTLAYEYAYGYSINANTNFKDVMKEAKSNLKSSAETETDTQAPVINNAITIDRSINNTMQLCAITFDTGNNLNSKYPILCDKIMITLDEQCRDEYYTFCFGSNWVNYELPKHKNPPWCNTKGIDC